MGQGKPLHFSVDRYLDSVEDMINADEVERAFWMLDNMPAYYRDHTPARAITIRNSLHKKLFTAVQYLGAHHGPETIDPEELMRIWPGRGRVIEDLIRQFNATGIRPNVMDLAPGAFWLPVGLSLKALRFTYESLGLDSPALGFDPPDNPAVNIFVALELIEHLPCEREIYTNYMKFGREANVVVLSTPLYTINGGEDKWAERDLGHLRTYTPEEFLNTAKSMFKGYQWTAYTDESIILVGVRGGVRRE